jgi:hypothetical protein
LLVVPLAVIALVAEVDCLAQERMEFLGLEALAVLAAAAVVVVKQT